jgi:hypothetical protein
MAETLLFNLKIAGRKIPVIEDPSLEDHGNYDYERDAIILHPNTVKDTALFEGTVRHELHHALFAYSGLAYLFTEDQIEAIIRMSDALLWNAVPVAKRACQRYNKKKRQDKPKDL